MITIAFCTPDLSKDKEFIDNINQTKDGEITIIPKICNKENGKTICQAYNEVIDESPNDIILLCHNDIVMLTDGWNKIIEDLFTNNPEYAILGTVGSNKFNCGSWLEKGGIPLGGLIQFRKNDLHRKKTRPIIVMFAPNYRYNDIVPSVCVDGFFMMINRKQLKAKYDEDWIKGFHFYDVEFCIDNLELGAKVGTTYKLDIGHYSDGFYNDAWNKEHDKCITKYQNRTWEIPIKEELGEPGMPVSADYYKKKSVQEFRKYYNY